LSGKDPSSTEHANRTEARNLCNRHQSRWIRNKI